MLQPEIWLEGAKVAGLSRRNEPPTPPFAVPKYQTTDHGRQTTTIAVPQTYAALRQAVQQVLIKGQQSIEQAQVRTYHDTGRIISEHVLLNRDRADHGSQTILRLAADLKIDRSILQRCVQFARSFPNCAPWRNLTWAHFRALIPVEDAKQRKALATEANRNEWSVVRLEERIRTLLPPALDGDDAATISATPPRLLTPKRGTPGVCRVVVDDGAPALSGVERVAADLGFACFRGLSSAEARGLKAGAFVQIGDDGKVRSAPDARSSDLFTYPAGILKVVDGDTLWVKVTIAPGVWVKQKLRLRDLDCPELATAGGKAARQFTAAQLAGVDTVTITTTRPDKYDRYLADVFIPTRGGEDIFLNNALLTAGHAAIKKAWEFSDWGEV